MNWRFYNYLPSGTGKQNINENWLFAMGEQEGAELPNYDDTYWELLDLPHDYSILQNYSTTAEAESGYKPGGTAWYRRKIRLPENFNNYRLYIDFDGVYMNASIYLNGFFLGNHPCGYTPFTFDLTDYLDTEAIEQVLAVNVRHDYPSSRWYSGSGIYRDVNIRLCSPLHIENRGIEINTIDLPASWRDDVQFSVKTEVVNMQAEEVMFRLVHELHLKGSSTVLAQTVCEPVRIAAMSVNSVSCTCSVHQPKLWTPSNPELYELVTKLYQSSNLNSEKEILQLQDPLDMQTTDYGFRWINFDAQDGFSINGVRLKLEGVCLHHDQGSLGAVACPQAIRRQIALLKDMGANAIRTAHNPASVGFIDSCNQMGMLVIEEAFDTWIKNKNGNRHDYGSHFAEKINMDNRILGKRTDETWAEFDLRAMIRRDYNAPSVIAWSLGNEVMEGSYGSFKSYPLVLEKLLNYGRMLDPFRAFTMGENKLKEDWEEAVYMADTLSDAQGWIGFNYADGDVLDRYHQKFPHWCIYGAETASALSSRAPYPTLGIDQKTRQITAYDKQTVAWGHQAAESWFCAITRDYVAGEFVWTGFDYLGEPTPWNGVGPGPVSHWPAPKSSYFGIIDTAGNPKDRFYFYQSQWRKDICVLHIVPAWHENILCIQNSNCAEKSNAVDFHEVEIIVYSNAASVELFITDYATQNTISLGKKTFSKRGGKDFAYQIYQAEDASDLAYENLYLRWLVPYKKGRLFAHAYDELGNIIMPQSGRSELNTFQNPKFLSITPEQQWLRADGQDLLYVEIKVLDNHSNLVEDAEEVLFVEVSGAGTLLALDSGNPIDHTPYKYPYGKTFGGKLIAIIQAQKFKSSPKSWCKFTFRLIMV